MPTTLVTLAEAKDYLQIDAGNTKFDTFLTDTINRVSDLIETFCNRIFGSQAYTEFHDGDGSQVVHTFRFPIVSVTELNDDPNRDFPASTKINADDFVIYADEGKIRLLRGIFGQAGFTIGAQNIKIVYTAGFATIPPAIEQAALEWTATVFNHAREGQDGIVSETLGPHAVSFDPAGIPAKIRQKLNLFKQFTSVD